VSYPPQPPNYPPAAPPPPGQPYQGGGAPQNTLGLISMILGIASIPLVFCCLLGFPLGIAAAVLGFLGRQKAAQGLATNDNQAKVGLITGAVGVGLSILWIILSFVVNIGSGLTPNF